MGRWSASDEAKRAMDEGLAVVHRKHKRQQNSVGPTRAQIDELFVVIDGELEILAGRKWRHAPQHTFACIRRGTYYGIRQKRGHGGRAHIVNVLFRAPDDWRPELPLVPIKLSAPWWRRFADLEARCDFDASGQRVLPCSEVMAFIERLARAASTGSRARKVELRDGPRRPDTGADWMETWARAEDVISQRAAGGLTVDELAAAVNVSPTQLRRVFLAARGIPPKLALTRYRVEQARKLLASGKWNVTQVAEQVGFATLQRFSAVFRTQTGETPTAFARRS